MSKSISFHKKEILIDAIIGRGFYSMSFANDMTKRGLAEFCGNQWNEDWRWKRYALITKDVEELELIYAAATQRLNDKF